MSWLQKLYATYEACVNNSDFTTSPPQADGEKENPALMPVSHVSQQAHIHVVLDGQGNFLRAELLSPKTQIVIPATEDSAGRTSGDAPHPLADKIHYCAKDYKGGKKNLYDLYGPQLKAWCASPRGHPKAQAVYEYVSRGTLVRDLRNAGILHADAAGALLTEAPADEKDSIFKRLVAKKVGNTAVRDQGDAVVVWSVIIPGDQEDYCTWKDKNLHAAWADYDAGQMQVKGLCMVIGRESTLAVKHPRNIRWPGDGAKLVSANDGKNFTFRGRFTLPEEACTVGYEVSQRAHNALRWLIARQGYRNGDQVVLVWAVNGEAVPNLCDWQPVEDADLSEPADSAVAAQTNPEQARIVHRDVGQSFALRLGKALSGYRAKLKDTDGISVLALDSASPGRLSVTFYREQIPRDYLDNLEAWHNDAAWILPVKIQDNQGGRAKPRTEFRPCAPLPKDIARAAYGERIDEKLSKATVERLLPCIADKSPIPRDLLESCVRRACNRVGMEKWEWPLALGVACALYKGFYARHPQKDKRRTYTMSLDKERRTRDYLYGRLLAAAEYIERSSLDLTGEKRPTNAERLMQRFADHPYSTWLVLYKSLSPYMQRLQSAQKHGLSTRCKKLLQEISDAFLTEDFISPERLSGEFLLGYHCQISDLYTAKPKGETSPVNLEGENA